VTILKEGKLPTEYYYGECAKCGTIFQATDREVEYFGITRHVTQCPLCQDHTAVYPLGEASKMLSANGIAIGTDATITFTGKPIIPTTAVKEPYTTTEYLIQSTPKNTITLHCSSTASPKDIQKIITKLKQLSI
jgi:hypothetical protein